MEKPGRSDHFPEGTGCKSCFFIMSPGPKLKCAFINSSPNNNEPKLWQSAADCGNMAISELCNVFTLQGWCVEPKYSHSFL